MKSAEEYAADAMHAASDSYGSLPVIIEAIKAIMADAQAEADERVAAVQRSGDKYRTLLVTAILRSSKRTHPIETQAMNAAHPAG